MLDLLIALLYHVGLIVMIGLIFSRARTFKNIFAKKKLTGLDKLTMSLLFGVLSIIGTITGIHYQGAIVNTRVIGVAIGGLLGGPLVGVLSGIIAGGHRWLIDIGGFTAVSCGISTLVEGIIAGLFSKAFRRSHSKIVFALVLGLCLESLQMIILMLIARPIEATIQLVSVISFPMILVNSIGIALFIMIITNIQELGTIQARLRARQALIIADKTLQTVRSGFNQETAYHMANQILEATDFDAVAITNTVEILAHVGAESNHHVAGNPVMTHITKKVIEYGDIRLAYSKEEIGCPDDSCALQAAVIVPIEDVGEIIGTLKFYRTEGGIDDIDVEMAKGLAGLLSTQLRLASLEEQSKLQLSAEIRALQAQISPHFFFNTLNVIGSLIRTNPDKAREVLVDLSAYLRKNMQSLEGEISLEEELKHIETFMSIIRARFGDQIVMEKHIEVSENIKLLPLLLQPLVENAIFHGIVPKGTGGVITLTAKYEKQGVTIEIMDDGVGMKEAKVQGILEGKDESAIGIQNVKKRIEKHYGKTATFEIESQVDRGSLFRTYLPMKREVED